MNILEQYSDRINGTFSFFDRIIIRGHITRFFTSNGMGSYASQCGVKLKDFSKYAESVTNELKASVKAYAEKLGRPIIYTPSPKESKEELHFKKTVAHGKKSKGEQNNDLRLCRYNSYGKLNRISAKTKERKRQTITISVMG